MRENSPMPNRLPCLSWSTGGIVKPPPRGESNENPRGFLDLDQASSEVEAASQLRALFLLLWRRRRCRRRRGFGRGGLVGALHGEGDAALVLVDLQDADADVLAGLHDVVGG